MDLSLVLKKLDKFKLYEYQHPFPTLFLEGSNPDEACNKAYYSLAAILLKQDDSKDTALLIKEIFNDITILTVQVPK